MKNSVIAIAAAAALIILLGACVSLQDREMTAQERAESQVLGSVTAQFNSFQFFHFPNKTSIKNKAYMELKKAAQNKYEGNIDIKNITIAGGGSALTIIPNVLPALIGVLSTSFIPYPSDVESDSAYDYFWLWTLGLPIGGGLSAIIGNFQEISATGDVVLLSGQSGSFLAGSMEGALNTAAESLIDGMPRNATIAILSVYSEDRSAAEYVIDELEYKFVDSKKFQIVDRRRLEQIRREQNFQSSGDVDDNSAVSIGNMLGATIVITGDISGSGSSRRLVLKALDVKTARIMTMARERF